LDQNPTSDWDAASARSRSALVVRSKKVSEFGDAALQLGKSLDEIGHANHSDDECSVQLEYPGANERAVRPPGGRTNGSETEYSRAQKIWRPPARISFRASLK
jgi:hypothetical protein